MKFTSRPGRHARFFRWSAAAFGIAALVACASAPQRQAQWVAPELGTSSRLLQGSRVLIACDFYDVTVRQICQDRLAREVRTRGAEPVTAAAGTPIAQDREPDAQLVPAANALKAKAVLVMALSPTTSNAGSGFTLGLGGFGIGRGGGAGLGLSAPLGANRVETGFQANARVTTADAGKLVWATTLQAAPSADLDAQFGQLAKGVLDAAAESGLF